MKTKTVLDSDGNYPTSRVKQDFPFSKLWREDFSYLPDVPSNWKDQDKWKKFAERVYNNVFDDHLQEAFTKAHDEGYDEGYWHSKEDFIKSLQKILMEAEDHYPMSKVIDFVRAKIPTL